MPLSDYTEGIGGGLKLKGVKDGRVQKSKKKKSKKDDSEHKSSDDQVDTIDKLHESGEKELVEAELGTDKSKALSSEVKNKHGKTEAQLRHEERRRQMLEEKMKKEGTKTHKEKVEELNKYLSRLSEHHDMPKIGPG